MVHLVFQRKTEAKISFLQFKSSISRRECPGLFLPFFHPPFPQSFLFPSSFADTTDLSATSVVPQFLLEAAGTHSVLKQLTHTHTEPKWQLPVKWPFCFIHAESNKSLEWKLKTFFLLQCCYFNVRFGSIQFLCQNNLCTGSYIHIYIYTVYFVRFHFMFKM